MQSINRIVFGNDHFLDGIANSIYFHFNTWLASHPFFYWLANHFLISVILGLIGLVLAIRLLLTIYYGIASAIDKMWLWILRSPFLLLKFIFGWESKSKDNVTNTNITNYEISHDSEQLQEILTCLERIQQQQQEIVRDLSILKRRSPDVDAIEIDLQPEHKELPSSLADKSNSS